jgi:hypothetical protein
MKRMLWLSAALIFGTIAVIHQSSRAQPGKEGPGQGGAVLRLPGVDAPAKSDAPLPYYLQPKTNTSAFPALPSAGQKIALPATNKVDINKDIEVTPQVGPWVILVMSYPGDQAPAMARNFVAVLRGTYKLNAYVFNYGAKEKQEEYERVQKIREEQRAALKREGINADAVPIRVPTIRIDEHTGVLVGGYKTFDEAANALKAIRKLNPEHLLGKVDLDLSVISAPTKDSADGKKPQIGVVQDSLAFVNPFQRAFPCRNPSLPKEQQTANPEEELNFLRKVNKGEPLSLLNCKQPFTLAVKCFDVQHKTMDASAESARKSNEFLAALRNLDAAPEKNAGGFLSVFSRGFGFKKGEWEDITAHNAHNLAEGLRKCKLDAYVLHAKYCSYVTVGGYPSIDDPRLLAMQNELERFFKQEPFNHPRLKMFPRPMPMTVPGVAVPKR